MTGQTTSLLKAALSALHYSGAGGLFKPLTAGSGVIFMLHHVTPEARREFDPNGILRITPQFLESVIRQVRDLGFEIVALDDVSGRLRRGPSAKPFAVFTLDDGYRDNAEHAYPVFKRHNVPFTIYIPPAFADGTGNLWWLVLEEALRRLPHVNVRVADQSLHFELTSDAAKTKAFNELYWALRALPEDEARAITDQLAHDAGIDIPALCRNLVMTWDEIRALAKDPLVTIGAHTVNHLALSKLSHDAARQEMADSIARVSAELGAPCRHFCYPYGCEQTAGEREFALAAELGAETAVTTRKGLLYSAHADALTALPRLSLNGDFQDSRYVKVLLSGVPFALLDAAKRFTPSRPGTGGAAAPDRRSAERL